MDFPTNESTRNMNEIESNPQVSHAGTNGTHGPNHEQVATLAYLIWLGEGCPGDRDKSNWYEAEQELRSEQQVANVDTGRAESHESRSEN